ncbi:DnaJ domain-containing protein [Choanephora cucurbitarum]|nr:DnaJ domain-containing protein [Choanephora cucurbitarum]
MQSIFDIQKDKSDLYAILNCVDTSSPEQIKTEYKRLALLHHPDKTLSESNEFEKIKAAYEIIGDPRNRALYDKWRNSSLLIPFSEYAQLGTHAQTVHWQSLPTQMTLTQNDLTETNSDRLKSIRVPATAPYTTTVNVNQTSFWKRKEYTIQER